MEKILRAVGAAGVIAALWAGGAWGQCEYDSSKAGNISMSKVIKLATADVQYNDPTARCVFIKGMPDVPDGSNEAFLNIGGESITINGLPGKQFSYKCKALNSSPKWDNGYYIYIPSNSFIDIKGAIIGEPKCPEPQVPPGSLAWNPTTGSTFTGGSGTWSTTGLTWTETSPSAQIAWKSSRALFKGTGATVTVSGAITGVNGISFDTSGYTLSGSGSLSFPTPGGATVTVGSGKSATIGVKLSGGPLTKDSLGILTLDAANDYTGATTIKAGTVVASKAGAFGAGTVNVSGAKLSLSGGISLSNPISIGNGSLISATGTAGNGLTGAVTLSGTDTISVVGTNLTISGAISANGVGILKTGAGKLTLTGENTTGTITVSDGTLQIGNNAATGSVSGAISVASGKTVTFSRSDNFEYAKTITGAGNLTKEGTGTLTLSGTNAYTGTTTITAGGITISDASNIGSGAITMGGTSAVLTFDASTTAAFARTVSGGVGTFAKSGAGTSTLNLSSALTVAKVNVTGGTLNTNTGAALNADSIVVASGATLSRGNATALGRATAPASTIVLNGGTLKDSIGTALQINGSLYFNGASTLKLPLTGLKTASKISVTGGLTISNTAKIDITIAKESDLDTGTYKIISATGAVSGDFGTNVTVNGTTSTGFIFSTKANGKTIELTIAKIGGGAGAIMNYLTVDSAKYTGGVTGGSGVSLYLSGLSAAVRSFIGAATGARIDSIYVWYKPGSAAKSTGSDTTESGGGIKIPLTSITGTTGSAVMFTLVVPTSKTIANDLYYFNVATFWSLVDGTPVTNQPTITSTSGSAYMLDPKKTVKNGLSLSVVTPGAVINEDGTISLTLSVSGQDDPALTPGVTYKPSVDTIGIWYKRNGAQPSLSATNNKLVKDSFDSLMLFSITALRNKATVAFHTGPLKNTVADTLHFAIAPRWKGAGIGDTIARPLSFTRAIATDPAKPKPNNPVTLTAIQKDKRLGEVSITLGVSEPFNAYADRVAVEMSLSQSMDYIIDIQELTLAQVTATGGYKYPVLNDDFVGAEHDVYYRVTVLDSDGLGVERQGSFGVGRTPPKPLAELTPDVCGNGSMCLSWSKPTAADNDIGDPKKAMVRIYYSETPISAGADVDALIFVEEVRAEQAEATVYNLALETDYWFAATLLDVVDPEIPDWTLASPAAVCMENTGSGKNVENILSIDTVVFNKSTTAFTTTVHLTGDYEEGHRYVYFVLIGADTVLTSKGPKAFEAFGNGESFQFTTDPLGDALMFDTTYRIYVYVINADNYTSVKRYKEVEIGPFQQQTVTVPVGVPGSAGSVNNGNFKLDASGWSAATVSSGKVNVTVESSDTPAKGNIDNLGFIPLGNYGYKYTVSASPSEMFLLGKFKISIRANGEIPPPYSPEDVRLYRWNENSGYWEVAFDTKYEGGYFTATAIDSAQYDLGKSYRLLINTMGGKPVITASGSQSEVVNADGSMIIASYTVSSNVGNYKIKMFSGPAKGSDALPETILDLDVTTGTFRRANFVIPGDVVNTSKYSGVLAFIVVNDGSAERIENISYRVKSTGYSGFPAEPVPKKWLPFAAQVELEKKSVKTALGRFYQEGDTFAVYDTLYRLFRWHVTAENRSAAIKNKWVEYNGKNDSTFDMSPTNLMWFKTSVAGITLDFGDATSMPLRDPYDITLPPGQWTDLVLPFSFNVCLGDILDATADANGANSLEFYRWEEPKDKKQKYSYKASPLVLATADSTAELNGEDEPFTVYNSGASAVILRIPPMPAFMSRYNKANKKKLAQSLSKSAAATKQETDGAWHYTLRAAIDGAELSDVLVGYSATERKFAVPPSFSNESVVIVGDDGEEIGHHFGPSIANGRTYKLRFYNDGRQRASFTFSAKPSANAPSNARVTFVKASTGETLGGGNGSDQSVTVAGLSHEDVFMIVGSGGYNVKAVAVAAAGAKFSIGKISVNKSARSAVISYYIPESGVNMVEVSIYNIKGRQVWKSAQKTKAAAWNTTEWNSRGSRWGAASTGLYIVRVKAIRADGRPVGVDTKRIVFSR
jgi:autotransporter-associated beta strand protein